jgi:NTE family protein
MTGPEPGLPGEPTAATATVVTRTEALAPVALDKDERLRPPRPGMALCLSGGGSRAMLFHAGALLRLNELGLLPQLDLVSSVSGGSIAAGVLARHWSALTWEGNRAVDLEARVVEPMREICRHRIDVPAFLIGFLVPGLTPATRFAQVLDAHLYGGAKLSELTPTPEFVFNATNLATTVLWRFSQAYMRDYRVGEVSPHGERLSTAVAASSAFPPAFAPLWLTFAPGQVVPTEGALADDAFRRRVPLADGGAYDNLGLEAAWKRYRTILVSDGGGETPAEPKPSTSLALQPFRVMKIIDRQVRSLRKRLLIDSYLAQPPDAPNARRGAYWGIRTNIAEYPVADALDCPHELTLRLAAEPTRLTRMPDVRQERLINWGHAIADAAIRAYCPPPDGGWTPPPGFHYPGSGVG